MFKKHILTKEGYEKFLADQKKLLSERPHAVKELTRAREMGDLSENGFYKGARAKLSQIDSQLRHLNKLLKHVELIKKPSGSTIALGTTVNIVSSDGERNFMIVGEQEANPSDGKISYKSPLGSNLIGGKVGDQIKIQTPSGETVYSIKKIS